MYNENNRKSPEDNLILITRFQHNICFLQVIRLGVKGYLEAIERAVSAGDVILLENIEENVDPVLDPLLGRNTIKKGRAIKVSDLALLSYCVLYWYLKCRVISDNIYSAKS